MAKNKMPLANFDLLSVKRSGNKKIEVKFFDRELPNRRQTNDDSNLPHQDLIDRLGDFAEEMALALSLVDGWDYARENLREAGNDKLKGAMDGYQDVIESISPSAVNFYGDKRPSIQLHGSVKYKIGSQNQSTPRIPLEGDNIPDYVDNLKTKGHELTIEVYKYLFEGKFEKKKTKKDENLEAAEKFESAIENGGTFSN